METQLHMNAQYQSTEPTDTDEAAAAAAAETAMLEKEISNACSKKVVINGEEAVEKRREERRRLMGSEMREEHALRNWKRHMIQWSKVERQLSHQTHKSSNHLLMCRLGEYREKIEEQELIEEAMALLENREINFWAPGLRIGNDLLGLM
ncbi:hypothetical protein HDU67_003885, partial [Dinochytrium kinnereticum]